MPMWSEKRKQINTKGLPKAGFVMKSSRCSNFFWKHPTCSVPEANGESTKYGYIDIRSALYKYAIIYLRRWVDFVGVPIARAFFHQKSHIKEPGLFSVGQGGEWSLPVDWENNWRGRTLGLCRANSSRIQCRQKSAGSSPTQREARYRNGRARFWKLAGCGGKLQCAAFPAPFAVAQNLWPGARLRTLSNLTRQNALEFVANRREIGLIRQLLRNHDFCRIFVSKFDLCSSQM